MPPLLSILSVKVEDNHKFKASLSYSVVLLWLTKELPLQLSS